MPIEPQWTSKPAKPRALGPPIPAPRRDPDVALRGGDPDRDGAAVARLAAMNDAPLPAAPWLVAVGGGEVRAVLSVYDGTSAADPFWPSAPLVGLLRERAAQLRRAAGPRGRRAVLRVALRARG